MSVADRSRRTPLIAGGFLAGALIGALPPLQEMTARMSCASRGGEWIVAMRACDVRSTPALVVPRALPPRERNLLNEEDR